MKSHESAGYRPRGQNDASPNGQETIGERDQHSINLAEEFLQSNASLLNQGCGTDDHDRYEAHLQEVFKVPKSPTVRGLASRPEASSLVRAQKPTLVKQEAVVNSQEASSTEVVVRKTPFNFATLSLEEQLPFLKIGQEGTMVDEYASPNLMLAIEPHLTNFQTAFVAVRHS